MFNILIDDREREVIEIFKKNGFLHEVMRLEVGDIRCEDVVIERKEMNDFLNSITDGRLIEQCNNMINNFKKCAIVIHGNMDKVIENSDINRNAVLGMMASIVARTNITMYCFNDIEDLCRFSYYFLLKATDGQIFKEITINKKKMNVNLQILTLIDGISLSKAFLLLNELNSVKEILTANKERLMEINGIGDIISNNIIKFGKILYG